MMPKLANVLLLLCVAALSEGADNADVVRDGDWRILPCTSSAGRPFSWKLCRVTSVQDCQPSPLEVEADGRSLNRTFYARSTTGVYSCVAKDDESTVFDTYYQLTHREWMEISPEKLKISRGESPTLTMTFLQLEGLDIKLNEVQIVYHPSQNDSEELLLANIPAIKLKDSVAVYNVNSTLLNNGSISVEALFAVNNVTHKVESAVEVMFVQAEGDESGNGTLPTPGPSPDHPSAGPVAGIIVACIVAALILLAGAVALVCYLIWRRKQDAKKGEGMQNGEAGNGNLQKPVQETRRRPEHQI